MDYRFRRVFASLYYFVMFFGAATLYFDKDANRLAAGILYGILTVMMTYQHLRYNKPEGLRPGGKKLMAAEMVCALSILYFERSLFPGIVIILIISNAIMVYETRFSIPYASISIIAYIGMLYYKAGTPSLIDFWNQQRMILLPRIIIILVVINTRNIVNANQKNKKFTAVLSEKNHELEAAMDELKKTADLRARAQLMNELHNKLGHILATASIGTEAAVVLMDRDVTHAKMQLESVGQQIRTAMQSLRGIIIGEVSYPSEIGWDYTDRITNLISETEKLTGIRIYHNLSEAPAKDFNTLSIPIQSFLYNTLMEGLTNGLRHGRASRFDFELKKKGRQILFRLRDNGIGFNTIEYGYGLTKIHKEAARFGAQLKITGRGGCVIEITLDDEVTGEVEKWQKSES